MADLIDRAALIANLNKFAPEHYNARINLIITKEPAVKAEPVKTAPCEYCDGQEKKLPSVVEDGSTYTTSFDGIWFNNGKAYLCDADGCDIPIKYCPMCGRRLEG